MSSPSTALHTNSSQYVTLKEIIYHTTGVIWSPILGWSKQKIIYLLWIEGIYLLLLCPTQLRNILQWLTDFPWCFFFSGCVWGIPTSTSLAPTPPTQPAIKGQGTKHRRLPNVAIFPAEIWKPVGVPKVRTNFKSDQHLWKSQLPYSWIKYFFINLTPACLCLETLKIHVVWFTALEKVPTEFQRKGSV